MSGIVDGVLTATKLSFHFANSKKKTHYYNVSNFLYYLFAERMTHGFGNGNKTKPKQLFAPAIALVRER